MSIPRILHRIWVGPEPMPPDFELYGERWALMHPDWEQRLWTEDNLPDDVTRREVLNRNRIPAERADVLRYELLARYGGVYVDADMEPLKPIDELLEGHDFFIGELKPGRINNAVFGAVPNHPILADATREATFMVYDDPQQAPIDEIKTATGPLFFAKMVDRHKDGILQLPPPAFYPNDDEREGAYTYHHAARTWVSFDPEQRERIILERDLAKEQRRLRHARARIEILEAEREDLRELVDALGSNRWLFRALRVTFRRIVRTAQGVLQSRRSR